MDVKLFRTIGFLYAGICFLGSFGGSIFFFIRLVQNAIIENNALVDGEIHVVIYTFGMIWSMLSATFSYLFAKIGVEKEDAAFIHIHKVYMLSRNLMLIIYWTYRSVALQVARIGGDASPEVREAQNTAATVLVAISALLGLEIWVINGCLRYLESRIHRDEHDELV